MINYFHNIQENNLQKLEVLGIEVPMAISSLEGYSLIDSSQFLESSPPNYIQAANDNILRLAPQRHIVISGQNNFTLRIDLEEYKQASSIEIINCFNFLITSDSADIFLETDSRFFITITNCKTFSIESLNCFFGRNSIFINDSSDFSIQKCSFSKIDGSALAIFNGNTFNIEGCSFSSGLSAAVLIVGNSYNGVVQNCICSHSRGYFNHDAAIHLCNTSEQVTPAHIPGHCHEALPIFKKTLRPHCILIRGCTLRNCRAQGIYLEGAVNCFIEDNVIIANNKEGICFDWGSCYNIFHRNIVSLNGERKKLSHEEIKADFISDYPLLEDGSSSMKLPGISLDNGCCNIIYNNKISNNYGGGIKMIRTALFNRISKNQILYNAIGTSSYIPYFHSLTALGLGAINNEFVNNKSKLLDFMPSVLNTFSENTIAENWQHIYMDAVSANNEISGNIILHNNTAQIKLLTFLNRAKGYCKRFIYRQLKKFSNKPG